MIKGVNKQIIEINDLENKVFEKAVLYIKPECADMSYGKLQSSAKEFANEVTDWNLWCIESDESPKRQRINSKRILLSLIGTSLLAGGAILTLLLLL